MIYPSTYYSLIYYQRIKLVTLLTFAILIVFGLVVILSLIKYLLTTYVTDVIIIGSGPFACHFQTLLKESGITSQLILPSRQYQLGYTINNSTPWSRPINDKIIFPEPSQDELKVLAKQYGLPDDLVKVAWEQLAKEGYKYPQDQVFLKYANDLGSEERKVYSILLKTSQARRAHVTSISQGPKLAIVKINNGENLYARLACLVEVSQEDLLEHYLDLDHPSGARVIQSYISTVGESGIFGSFFESKKTSFRYHRDNFTGLTLLSTDANVEFQPETSSYSYELPKEELYKVLGLTNLPSCPFRVSHLFFPWRQQPKSPIILDTTNIASTSPERDLIIVIQTLTKMLYNKLSC